MPIPFGRLGSLFSLFSASFYPRRAKQHVFDVAASLGRGAFVADIGGGAGTLLDLARKARADLRYVCVDPAVGMLKHAPPYAYRVAARSEELPFRDGGMEAVLIGDALHHFTDPEKAIGEVHRVLKQEATLFVFDIDPKTVMGRMVVALERALGEPAHFCSPAELQQLLLRKGFGVSAIGRGWRYTLQAEKAG